MKPSRNKIKKVLEILEAQTLKEDARFVDSNQQGGKQQLIDNVMAKIIENVKNSTGSTEIISLLNQCPINALKKYLGDI
jgi:hypothetical protein